MGRGGAGRRREAGVAEGAGRAGAASVPANPPYSLAQSRGHSAADYFLRGDQIGSIEKGKSADLVVLDKDYMTIPEDDIVKIAPQMTVFDGKIIFLPPAFSTEYNLKPAGAPHPPARQPPQGRYQPAARSA